MTTLVPALTSLNHKVPMVPSQVRKKYFSNFSCRFLNPNYLLQFNCNCSNLLDLRNLQKQVKKAVSKNFLNFHCSNKLLWWSQNVCKFLAFSLEFQKFFLITKTIFSHSRSEQFWKQNTICSAMQLWSLNLKLTYSFPAKQNMHYVCNSYTHIMFYKQCSYWTTGYPFPKFWWSLILVAYFWQKNSNGNFIVIKRACKGYAIEITFDFILETNRKPISENVD